MNHNWAPIDPDDDPSEMCNTCLQCKCCDRQITEECPGAWVDEYGNPEDTRFADSTTVLDLARRISEENVELLKRLS